ncbi:MAG: hypothetical protein ACPGUF_00210, partial [Litorivicinus sp.]
NCVARLGQCANHDITRPHTADQVGARWIERQVLDFAVVSGPAGEPRLQVEGKAAATAGEGAHWHLSLSDDGGFAQAFTVLEQRQ